MPPPGGRKWVPWPILALPSLLPLPPAPQHCSSYVTVDRTAEGRW